MAHKLLFVFAEVKDVRPFEDTLIHLAKKAYPVHVAIERDPSGEGAALIAAFARYPLISFGVAPASAEGGWSVLGRTLRGCLDCWRWLDGRSGAIEPLLQRAQAHAPTIAIRTARSRWLRRESIRRLATRALSAAERAIPVDPAIAAFVTSQQPSVIVVSPLLQIASSQVDYLRAARANGVGSLFFPVKWDDLHAHGLLHEQPDAVAVWNRYQRREAIELQGMLPQRTAVLGANGFAWGWTYQPTTDRDGFCELLGLSPAAPLLLFAGVSQQGRPAEVALFEIWLKTLRHHADPRLRNASVIVQSSAENFPTWYHAQGSVPGQVVVLPPAEPGRAQPGFDPLVHADAVVALDMSLVMPAAALGRPLLALLSDELAGVQDELRRFRATVGGQHGWPLFARSLDKHFAQLAKLVGGEAAAVSAQPSARSLLHPHGPDLTPGFVIASRVVSEVIDYRGHAAAPAPVNRMLTRALAPVAWLSRWLSVDRVPRPAPVVESGVMKSLRILVATPSLETLDRYRALLQLLLRHGHRVAVTITSRRGQKAGRFDKVMLDVTGLELVTGLTPRAGIWGDITDGLRGMAVFTRFLDARSGPPDAAWRVRFKRQVLRPEYRVIDLLFGAAPATLRRLQGALTWLSRATPVAADAAKLVSAQRPDVVVVLSALDATVAFESAASQVDLIQAARRQGVPVAASAGLADLPTNDALLHARPDTILLWNERQKKDAVETYGFADERLAVTGAGEFDHHLDSVPTLTVEEFHAALGLPTDRPFLLFGGSTGLIADPGAEVRFVHDMVRSLRQSGEPALERLPVVIRPAPGKTQEWRRADFTGLGPVVLCPRDYDRFGELDDVLLHESVRYAGVVVGAHAGVLTLAAALGRPAIAVIAPESSRSTPDARLLHHLHGSPNARVALATSNAMLLDRLRQILTGDEAGLDPTAFIRSVVRPHGGVSSVAGLMAARIEDLGRHAVPVRDGSHLLAYAALPLVLVIGGIARAAGWVSEREITGQARRTVRNTTHRSSKVFHREVQSKKGQIRKLGRRLGRVPRLAAQRLGVFVRGRVD